MVERDPLDGGDGDGDECVVRWQVARVGGAEVVVACVVDPWWRRRRRDVVPLAGWLAGWLAGYRLLAG